MLETTYILYVTTCNHLYPRFKICSVSLYWKVLIPNYTTSHQ